MKHTLTLSTVMMLAVACGTSDHPGVTEPSMPEVAQNGQREVAEGKVTDNLRPRGDFRAHLRGQDEVPPRETPARGEVFFHASSSQRTLLFTLTLVNIENVVAVHIHLGAAGTNGPIVAFLYGPVPPGGGRARKVLGPVIVRATDLVGPLAGHSLSELVGEMRAGHAYVNVHTDDGVPPANTSSGDFPGGELRGQILADV